MVDNLDSNRRSWNMSRIRSGNTKPELIVRSILHRMGYRFRLHSKLLPGKPDIVLPKYQTVVFVHGCFWHHHEGCKYSYMPKSRVGFWEKKFEDNIERDKRVIDELNATGWKVLTIWECEIKNPSLVISKIQSFLTCVSE